MYYLVKFLSKFFCLLPRGFSLRLGKCAGRLFYFFSRKKRAQALKNIRLAFPDEPFSKIVSIAKRSFENFVQSLIETLRLPKEVEVFSRNLVIEDKERFFSLKEAPSILLGIHSGNWELLNSYLGGQFPYVILAKRQKGNNWNRFLNELRASQGLKVVYEDDLRSLVEYLKKGYILGIVFDAGFRESNLYSEFFGKLLPTPSGALKIALNFKRKIFAGFLKREKNFQRLVICEPQEIKDKREFPRVAKLLNSYFEDFLKKHPFEYLWWYKRFKRAKNLNILVLSDNKPGHLKQSLALAKLIEEKRPISLEAIEVRLSGFQRFLLEVFNLFSSKRCFGCFKCLRFILRKDFERVFKYADVIISCGASLSSLNRILGYNLGAKSFIIQRPNTGLEKFDLVILPSHDKAPKFENIVRIKGSLSFFLEEEIEEAKEKLKGISKEIKDNFPKIGVFLGGPIEKNFDKNFSLEFLKNLKKVSLQNSWQLFLTTSRRTPPFLENFLEKEFKDFPLLVIANKRNFPFVSLGIISLCDVILVSSDSISMITEASSLKPTLVFDAFRIKSRKHLKFLGDISQEGYMRIINAQNLEKTLRKILNKNILLKNIDNKKVVELAVSLKF